MSFVSRSVHTPLKWEGLKYYKRKFTKADFWKGLRPDSRSLVGSSWPWWLKRPTTTVQAVMDGESYFINIRLFNLEDFFGFAERKGARDVGNPSWLREELQITPGERSPCERWTRMLSGRWCQRLRHAWAKLLTSPVEASGILNT